MGIIPKEQNSEVCKTTKYKCCFLNREQYVWWISYAQEFAYVNKLCYTR